MTMPPSQDSNTLPPLTQSGSSTFLSWPTNKKNTISELMAPEEAWFWLVDENTNCSHHYNMRCGQSSPWVMVRRRSSRLRNVREATWGFPQRSVSSSTSSSNFIQRALSFQCMSWFLSTISSFSSTNTWPNKRIDPDLKDKHTHTSDWALFYWGDSISNRPYNFEDRVTTRAWLIIKADIWVVKAVRRLE